jgi:septation ring formation regulator EzrA
MNQAHLKFTTNPLSSSEIFLLSYLDQKNSAPARIPVRKKCKNDSQIIGTSVMQSMEDAALVGPREYFKNWQSKVTLPPEEIQKIKARCNAMSQVDLNDRSAVHSVLDKCENDLSKRVGKISKELFDQKKEIGKLYLESLPPELKSVPDKINGIQKVLKIINENLADEEDKKPPSPEKIARMQKGIKSRKEELEKLEHLAQPIREGQIAAVEGRNTEFTQFLESKQKGDLLKALQQTLEEKKEIVRLQSHIARVKYPEQLTTALDLVSKDPNALSTYLRLLKCESEGFGPSAKSQTVNESLKK